MRQQRSWQPIVPLLFGGLGVGVFPAFLWWKFGDPLLYFHIHADGWSQTPSPFYSFLKHLFLGAISYVVDHKVPLSVDPMGANLFPINFGVFLAMLWALRASILKKRWEDVALMAGACFVAASAGNLLSISRIALIYYPISLRLGEAMKESPALRFAVVFVFLPVQALLLALFARWVFVI